MPASACAPGKYPDLQAERLITVMVVATDFHRTSLSSSKLEPAALKCEIVARNADMFSIARKMACVNVRRRGLFLMAATRTFLMALYKLLRGNGKKKLQNADAFGSGEIGALKIFRIFRFGFFQKENAWARFHLPETDIR